MAAEAKVNAIANTAIMAIVFLIISSLNYRLKIALETQTSTNAPSPPLRKDYNSIS